MLKTFSDPKYGRNLSAAAQLMKESKSWLIVVHEHSDGDTLGCGLAVYMLGARLGKKVRIIGKDPIPASYGFMPCSDMYERIGAVTFDDVMDTLVICVDTSSPERSVGNLCKAVEVTDSINIDHHGDNRLCCDVDLVVAEASATAEIVTDLFETGGWKISTDEALCLYVGLVTDNGNFRFKSTTSKSHECAAKLLSAGVDPSYADDRITQNMTPEILKLWGTAFCRTETFAGDEAAIFWLTGDDFKKAGADAASVDGLVNMLMRICGVKIAAFLSDLAGQNKLSVRTRMPYSARDIASAFGGGGHIQAAGAKVDGTFEDALKKVRSEIEKHVCNGNSADK